jgi:nicotinamidase-related amidase
MTPQTNSALIVIDLQYAIDDSSWSHNGPRNNPHAEASVARLLHAWRARSAPVVHIRHDSVEPNSPYRPGQHGNDFRPETAPLRGETVIAKHTPDAFTGTELEKHLHALGVRSIVICGVVTNNSVEATARHAGCLGFDTYVVEDACFTFAKKDWRGRLWSADEVHALSLANLNGEYASILTTHEALAFAPAQTTVAGRA